MGASHVRYGSGRLIFFNGDKIAGMRGPSAEKDVEEIIAARLDKDFCSSGKCGNAQFGV